MVNRTQWTRPAPFYLCEMRRHQNKWSKIMFRRGRKRSIGSLDTLWIEHHNLQTLEDVLAIIRALDLPIEALGGIVPSKGGAADLAFEIGRSLAVIFDQGKGC